MQNSGDDTGLSSTSAPRDIASSNASENSARFVNNNRQNVPGKMEASLKPFMIWIDAVGGFLVCPGDSNVIGQAVPDSNVQIPLIGDLQRRHVRIEPVDGGHMLHPFGEVEINGNRIEDTALLSHGQEIALRGGVTLRFLKSHPLSSTAKLEFASRHRTHPWSDGVILASGPVIFGPDPKCHVVCKHLSSPIMLFNREGKWLARSAGKLVVDSIAYEGEAPLELTSRIQTEEFSLTMEAFPA